jgi:hypothetical protein
MRNCGVGNAVRKPLIEDLALAGAQGEILRNSGGPLIEGEWDRGGGQGEGNRGYGTWGEGGTLEQHKMECRLQIYRWHCI